MSGLLIFVSPEGRALAVPTEHGTLARMVLEQEDRLLRMNDDIEAMMNRQNAAERKFAAVIDRLEEAADVLAGTT